MDRYIGKPEIAALFGSSWEAAEEQLVKAGLRPINLGAGRKRGKRWLESAVMDAMRRIHEKAQPRPAHPRPPKPKGEYYDLGNKSVGEVQAMLARLRPVASSTPIQ